MSLTVADIIDGLLSSIPGSPGHDTVDTIKTGDPSQPVKGVVTTFMATQAVIHRAIDLGANLIITHEPTFYSHRDETDWLAEDPVYRSKRQLLDEHDIVVWRFHDNWHRRDPDGIYVGVLRQLGWETYADADTPALSTIPPTTVSALAQHLKASLGISSIRLVGDPQMACSRIGLMVGAPGARWQIRVLREAQVDVLLCGEINEWETSEYVRDAVAQGREVALLVIGHVESEEPGMAYLAELLQELFPGVPATHVPCGSAFTYL